MSQEYTPVSWQDETTSQQGTLINAERLNQMQTAHHYADGFEEVDEIPTESPGTDYHKIVYCTEDAAFYRWDGTQWTKDVDDVTRAELDAEIERAEHAEGLIQGYLDAHEANHNNPHQVTKAQVGLGNCDNTADLDKPISTAAQAALDTKADKADTLAGYGITDAYTKTEADTLLADKADKADVYDKTAADTLLAGKVDKLVSSPAGTYKSVTVNAQGQVTAGTNPDTLAGYGITDAYTKTEADTLLAAKADTTALTDGSVTKLGTADLGTDTKPIKLVAGVPTAVTNDLVSTSGVQEITGTKTFNGSVYLKGRAEMNQNNPFFHITNSGYEKGSAPSANKISDFRFEDKNGAVMARMIHTIYSDGDGSLRLATSNAADNTSSELLVGATAGGQHFVRASYRDYAPANTGDVATIGTLDGYSPMVRTTGNQTKNGIFNVHRLNACPEGVRLSAGTYYDICSISKSWITEDVPAHIDFIVSERAGIGIGRLNIYSNAVSISEGKIKTVEGLTFKIGRYTGEDERYHIAVSTTGTNRYINISVIGCFVSAGLVVIPTMLNREVVTPTADLEEAVF